MNFNKLNKLKQLLNSNENNFLRLFFLNENNKLFLILYQILKNKKIKDLKYKELYKQIFYNDLNFFNNSLSPENIYNLFLFLKYDFKIKLNENFYDKNKILNNYIFYLNKSQFYINNVFNYYLKNMLELVGSNINDTVDNDIFLELQKIIDEYLMFTKE